MEQLIKKVYDTFNENQAIFTNAGLVPISTVDRYRGQPMNPSQFEIYPLPAIFIAHSIDWVKQARVYKGTVRLDFHVVIDEPWGTSDLYVDYEEALKQVFYYQQCRLLLDDLESQCNGKLWRTGERPVDTGVICYQVLSYAGHYYDVCNSTNLIPVPDATAEMTSKQLVEDIRE